MLHRPTVNTAAGFLGEARWFWLSLAAVLILSLGILGYYSRRNAPAKNLRPASAEAVSSLALNVERNENNLRLSWNGSSPIVRTANQGVLTITDGNLHKDLKLDRKQLTSGSIVYWPASNDVNFRLEVFAVQQKSVSESVRAVGIVNWPGKEVSTTREVPASVVETDKPRRERPAIQARPKSITRASPRKTEPVTSGQERNETTIEPVTTATAGTAPTEPVQPPQEVDKKPSPFSEPPPPQEPKPSRPIPRRAQVSLSPAKPNRESSSRLSRWFGKVPGVGLFRRNNQAAQFIGPKPVRQESPVLPAEVSRKIGGEVPIDVRVQIDKSGNVVRAEPISGGRAFHQLTVLALNSARRWQFTPARVNNQNVSSELVIHFRFR